MTSKYKIIKDIKVKPADTGIESLFLINGEILPVSSMQIVERAGDTGKLLLEIPMAIVEVIAKPNNK